MRLLYYTASIGVILTDILNSDLLLLQSDSLYLISLFIELERFDMNDMLHRVLMSLSIKADGIFYRGIRILGGIWDVSNLIFDTYIMGDCVLFSCGSSMDTAYILLDKNDLAFLGSSSDFSGGILVERVVPYSRYLEDLKEEAV